MESADALDAAGRLVALNFDSALMGANFVPGITPSFSHFRQPASAVVGKCAAASVQ
jgi:hypothetical protein